MTLNNNDLAILIDADNVSAKYADGLFAEVAKLGTARVKRIYGDWSKPALKAWVEFLPQHAVQPIQQFAYTTGKNSTDNAMIIDAMDLMYSGRFGGICIVSSDTDFIRLAMRIREQGMKAYGFGERAKTPMAFRAACDTYIDLDEVLAPSPSATPAPVVPSPVVPVPVMPAPKPVVAKPAAATLAKEPPKPAQNGGTMFDKQLLADLKSAIEANVDKSGTSPLSKVASHLNQVSPGFSSKKYGYSKFSKLVEASGIATVKPNTHNTHLHVRLH